MKAARWLGLLVVGAFIVGACGKKSDGGTDTDPEPCGDETCSDRQECDDSGREPRCECAEAYEGSECELCAEGYEEVDGACQAIEVDCDDNPCGLRGACVSETGKADRCECNEYHAGPTCAQCVDGYQDNDQDDECAVGCDSPDFAGCEGFFVCDDTGGEALCVCPVGSAGDACELCESGDARRGDEPCYETCASPDFACDEPLYCFDDGGLQPAECVCAIGYQGAACDECEAGFEASGDSCVRSSLTGFDLLTLGRVRGRTSLMGLDSTSGELTPLFAVEGAPDGLVYDSTADSLYVANYQGVHRVNWESGETTLMASAQIGHGRLLAVDEESGLLYSMRSADDMLFTVDPSDDSTADIAVVQSSWLWDATYRSQDGTLYMIRSQGLTPTVHTVDPSDAAVVEVGSVTGAAPIGSQSAGGIAALEDGSLAVLSREDLEMEDAMAHACAEAADRLGLDGYEDAPFTIDQQENAPNTVLTNQASSGKEIVIYRSYGGTGANVITIDVDNPDAFICISTYEENFEIAIPAGARWAAGLIYSYQSTLTGSVADGFSGESLLYASGGGEVDLSALALLPEAFFVLSSQEFSDRRLPSLSDIDSYSNTRGPYTLRVLSVPGLTEDSAVSLEGDFAGGLSAF